MENMLIRFNEWWKTGNVPKDLLKEYKRPLIYKMLNYISDRQIIKLYGLRRTGKSVIFYQLIDKLLGENDSRSILYFSFDETKASLEEIFDYYKTNIIQKDLRAVKRVYVFLDEIQKLEDWQNKIKIFYDLYPNIKFFVSGSSTLAIKKKAGESLVGRTYDFHLKPLDFREFILLKNKKLSDIIIEVGAKLTVTNAVELGRKLDLYSSDIKILFFEFIKKGGFIEITNEEDEYKINNYLRNSIIDKVVFQDIPEVYRIEDPHILLQILKIVSNNPGLLLEFDSLANDLKLTRQTIANYISYLESSLVLKLLYNYSKNMSTSSKKLKKCFLGNTAFLCALLETPIDDTLFGKIIENLIACQIDTTYFWKKDNYEVDIIANIGKKLIPAEVKYRNEVPKSKALIKFMEDNSSEFGMMVTKDLLKTEGSILYIPAWLLLLADV